MKRQTWGSPRKQRVLLWCVLDMSIVSVVFWQAVHFNDPLQSEAPASIVRLSTQIRSLALKPGDLAPNFRLKTRDGQREITLNSLQGGKPIVLVFGSYSCPYFRGYMNGVNDIFLKYNDAAQFYLVYIKEAHPEEDGLIPENAALDPIPAPTNFQERALVAMTCAEGLGIDMPILVDDVDDTTAHDYQAWPARVCVIDRKGRIAYSGEQAGQVNLVDFDAALRQLASE